MNLLLSILLSSLALLPQGDDQAERLFDQAQTFMNAGKYKEALTDLETVVASFGETPYAPQALLAMGDYYFEIEGDTTKAASYYERVKQNYAGSSAAPAAYYQEARIADQRSNLPADLEAAVADLIRMKTLYPDNAWSAQAMALHGKLAWRLGQYEMALSYFQRLEFNHPNAQDLPAALLTSARTAYLMGSTQQAADTLARLQRKFPNTEESARAAALLRLLERQALPSVDLNSDNNFFGAVPKRFDNPKAIVVTPDHQVCIIDDKGAHFGKAGPYADMDTTPGRDLVDVTTARDGDVILVYENRLVKVSGNLPPLQTPAGPMREMASAAVDNFGRLYVVDDDARAVQVFDRDGTHLQTLRVNRPQRVRTFRDQAYITDNDGRLHAFDGAFQPTSHPWESLTEIDDFRFDPLGNLALIRDRGDQLQLYNASGRQTFSLNLKGSALPLKQAEGIGIDAAGSIYLSDRRGGSVYRFQ